MHRRSARPAPPPEQVVEVGTRLPEGADGLEIQVVSPALAHTLRSRISRPRFCEHSCGSASVGACGPVDARNRCYGGSA
jgi:hypothetical protein